MKPTAEWTSVQKMEFFDLLIGLEERDFYSKWDYFFMVKDFMEKEMPEVWNQYLYETHGNTWLSTKGWKRYDIILNEMLSLDNLLSFLLSNTEWGWKECQMCKGRGWYNQTIQGEGTVGIYSMPCKCNTGKIKHPALVFAESLKEERCGER